MNNNLNVIYLNKIKWSDFRITMKIFLILMLYFSLFDVIHSTNICDKYKNKKNKDTKIKNKIDYDYSKLGYNFSEPFIVLNPYRRSPLSALIKFNTQK